MQEQQPLGALLPIGRFSQMTRLSVKALRLYDEQGLLNPAWVDPSSGYRYYSPGQAPKAEAIRMLRSTDMPLDEIRLVLLSGPEVVNERMAAHQERLTNRLEENKRMLGFLDELIDGRKKLMSYEIEVKTVPDQLVAATEMETSLAKVGEDIQQGFGALVGATMSQNVPFAGAPFIIYHDIIDEETDGRIQICVPTAAEIEPANGVISTTISGGPAATTVHRGPYAEVGPAYHAVSTWVTEHGHNLVGPPRETYLNDPTEVPESDLLTEVSWPIDAE